MRHGFLLVLLMLAAGAPAPTPGAHVPCRARKPDSWDVELAGPREPGPRLEVTGAVYSALNNRPLPGVTVYVYHADRRGQYGVDGRGRFDPRLCGILLTNEQGQYRFRTVMPGGYEGAPHVHYEVWGPSVGHQGFLLQFGPELPAAADGYAGPRLMGGSRDDPTAMERPFTRDARGVMHVVRDLRVMAR